MQTSDAFILFNFHRISHIDRCPLKLPKSQSHSERQTKQFRLTKPTFGLVIIFSDVAPGQIAVAQALPGTSLLVNVLLFIDLCLPTYPSRKSAMAVSVKDQLNRIARSLTRGCGWETLKSSEVRIYCIFISHNSCKVVRKLQFTYLVCSGLLPFPPTQDLEAFNPHTFALHARGPTVHRESIRVISTYNLLKACKTWKMWKLRSLKGQELNGFQQNQ